MLARLHVQEFQTFSKLITNLLLSLSVLMAGALRATAVSVARALAFLEIAASAARLLLDSACVKA